QWGNASGENEEADNSTTFPIAFPSTCFVVLLTSKRYISSNRLLSQSKTGFTWTAKSGLISWAALGM
ncbi:gp53-like domain-containing protein, partial [Mitsuokella jalaludinii]|uniref:gp53-like domain-containing protein n=1 Tax=Mitsuokella jalaludinii TaxID=187979 RepID=UPI003F64EF2F